MNNLFSLLPKKTLILIFGLIILLGILLYFLLFGQNSTTVDQTTSGPTIVPQQQRKSQPLKPPFLRPTQDSEGGKFKVVFNLPQGLVLPESVDGVIVRRTLDENLTSSLLSTLNITGEPTVVKNTTSWSSNDRSLLIDTSSGYVLYGQSGGGGQSQPAISIGEIENRAAEFVNDLNFVKVTPNTATTRFYRGENEIVETDNLETADFVEFSYQQAFNNTPIYYQFATPASVSITTDKSGQVLRLQYFNIQPIEIVDSTRIDIEKIKRDVEQGKFTIASIDGSTAVSQGTITVTNARVVYFDDKSTERFYPIILLEGTLQPGSRAVNLYYSILGN